MLKPLDIVENNKPILIRCRHGDKWPPGWARSGQSAEALRAQGFLKDEQFERARTWERVCGLMAMSPEKCPTCPYALQEDGLPMVASIGAVAPATYRRKGRKK